MTFDIFSVVLAVPPLLATLGAWFVWARRISVPPAPVPRWRQKAITVGLAFLTLNVAASVGYLLYELSARTVKWTVFDDCSSIGAMACLVGILGAVLGKGAAVRLLLMFGSLGGMLFWYLTIGPRS